MSQITTHILDTTSGLPAAGVPVKLSQRHLDVWQMLATGVSNPDGRVLDLLPNCKILDAGIYSLHFDTELYHLESGQPVFYPFVDVVFSVDASGRHYHVPLLLSPYGYSTYRGS